jgi:hypothetical protein
VDPQRLADIVTLVHFSIAAFIVLGQLLILIGWPLRWEWVRNFWFRVAHLGTLTFIVVQTLCNFHCPLTMLEEYLRDGSLTNLQDSPAFVVFCHRILFWPAYTFDYSESVDLTGPAIGFGTFLALVVLTWIMAPPRWPFSKTTVRQADTETKQASEAGA